MTVGASKGSELTGKKPLTCWLCNETHKASECPHHAKLNALQAKIAQEQCRSTNTKEEEESIRLSALRFLSALKRNSRAVKKNTKKGVDLC